MYLCSLFVCLVVVSRKSVTLRLPAELTHAAELIYFVNVIHHLPSVALILIRLFTDKISCCTFAGFLEDKGGRIVGCAREAPRCRSRRCG